MQTLNWKIIVEIIGGALFLILLAWFFFFRSPGLEPTDTAPVATFSQSGTRVGADVVPEPGSSAAQTISSPISKQRVFKISDGPVAGATFMQDGRPTTTVARFVMQQNGHVLDLALDSPGAVSRAASNTTIPGAARVIWAVQTVASRQVAAAAALQYIDNGTIKSVVLAFPIASTTGPSTSPAPVRVQFLPDNIRSLAASPDGLSLAYLVPTSAGSDIYTAKADGTNPKKLTSLPLSQAVIVWPSNQTLLATSKAAAGVPGIAFSISVSSGATSPILYAMGLSATADQSFSQVVYQSATAGSRLSFTHNTKTNLDRPLSYDPMPEKCVWSALQSQIMFCATPISYTGPEYADLWRQGSASAADSVIAYDLITGKAEIVVSPGGVDGGVASDIMQMALSADEKYLLFVSKGDRSLWGIRLRDF